MLQVVTRSEWGARAPSRTISSAPVSRAGLVVHHTVTPQWVGALAARRIQDIHQIGMSWADVGYTFLIDVDGVIYEGRDLAVTGAHTRGHNTTRHAVAIIGDFTSRRVPDPAVEAVRVLHHAGAERGWWAA